MVLRPISQSAKHIRTSPSANEPIMASSTLKSHPLHNFPLPDLRWGINHPNNHRLRRPGDSARRSPQTNAHSELSNSAGAAARYQVSSSERKPCDLQLDKSVRRWTDSDSRSKIFIRIPLEGKKCIDEASDGADQNSNAEDIESTPKVWNLRPRRPIHKAPIASGAAVKKIVRVVGQEARSHRPDPSRTRNITEAKVVEKKQKFSVSLSKDEIGDDIFSMTGSKPSRRPKKRVKNVQKQLDWIFPGLWLASAPVTVDLYKVSDAPPKV